MLAQVSEPIAYLPRIRRYYEALGYGAPYEWARVDPVPFTPLHKPLAASRVALITTAAPYRPGLGDQGPGAPYNARAKFYQVYSLDAAQEHDLRISHVAIDRAHTTGADPASYFPHAALRAQVAAGRIGALTARLHGAPTNRSQRTTLDVDGPEIVERCIADGADCAVLVPNCPVCHQTCALIAGLLEARGISSVVMGCALDLVEHVGVPRFVFSDFPLGNAAGRPDDAASQTQTLELALQLLETADAPRTTLRSPLRWSDNDAWKLDYSNIDRLTPGDIQRRRAEFDAAKAQALQLRAAPGPTVTGAG